MMCRPSDYPPFEEPRVQGVPAYVQRDTSPWARRALAHTLPATAYVVAASRPPEPMADVLRRTLPPTDESAR